MKPPTLASLASLDGLSDIGLRGGVDMRPTLLRVLTDLYMQKLTHTADEERHYTELALRLLEAVDVPTRLAVAVRLARHMTPPLRVIQSLANDLPEVAAPLQAHPLLQSSNPAGVAQPQDTSRPHIDEPANGANGSAAIDATTAAKLNDFFLSANANERGLILRNLDVVAPISVGLIRLSRDPAIGQRLEAAALARNREDFTRHLAQALHIPREQARRVARDLLGEPIVIVAKALEIARSLLYRILMFVNPSVGHSVERVHTLATLYDETTFAAAVGMVAIWQALPEERRMTATYQPLLSNDEGNARLRPDIAARRAPATPQTRERRDAS
jgi:hypothetical protein